MRYTCTHLGGEGVRASARCVLGMTNKRTRRRGSLLFGVHHHNSIPRGHASSALVVPLLRSVPLSNTSVSPRYFVRSRPIGVQRETSLKRPLSSLGTFRTQHRRNESCFSNEKAHSQVIFRGLSSRSPGSDDDRANEGGRKTKVDAIRMLREVVSNNLQPMPEKASASTRRKRKDRVLSDYDKDVHKRIIQMQTLRKAESRRKTAHNVYRALCGNIIICAAKLGAWASSGSSSMLSEFIHSVVDVGNQSLLLVGLTRSGLEADRAHPYGYGKSVYFWALVSALGTFFLGAGVSMTHAVGEIMHPSLTEITWQVWGVLVLGFVVDGYVFQQTLKEIRETKPKNVSLWKHFQTLRDPATVAVLLEDGAACLGVVMALGGIVLSHTYGNPLFDGIAGIGISTLLGLMGVALVRVNHRFLLGQAVDKEITDEIGKILVSRRSIDAIGSVQSQWISSDSFSYKAEVDFDGTYLAAKLMPIYQQEFMRIQDTLDEELKVLLAFYAEDVMRTVEREVRQVEMQIRLKYPGAEYIELEPMSVDVDRVAIYDDVATDIRDIETAALDSVIQSLRKEESKQAEIPGTDPSTTKP